MFYIRDVFPLFFILTMIKPKHLILNAFLKKDDLLFSQKTEDE